MGKESDATNQSDAQKSDDDKPEKDFEFINKYEIEECEEIQNQQNESQITFMDYQSNMNDFEYIDRNEIEDELENSSVNISNGGKYNDDGFNQVDRSSESDFEFISEDEAQEAAGYVFINDNDLEESVYQDESRITIFDYPSQSNDFVYIHGAFDEEDEEGIEVIPTLKSFFTLSNMKVLFDLFKEYIFLYK
jgi:hypothetical protein